VRIEQDEKPDGKAERNNGKPPITKVIKITTTDAELQEKVKMATDTQ
jgi:hypothetical protein